MGIEFFDIVNFILVFDPLIENFNLGYNFWMVGTRTLIFHMSIPWDKTFLWIPKDLTLWPW
jgi:hypothetical protein